MKNTFGMTVLYFTLIIEFNNNEQMQDILTFQNLNNIKMTDTEDKSTKINCNSLTESVEYSVTKGHKPLSIIIKRNVTPVSKKKRKNASSNILKKEPKSLSIPSNDISPKSNWNDSLVKNNSESSSFPLELTTSTKVPIKKLIDNTFLFSNTNFLSNNSDSFIDNDKKHDLLDCHLGHFSPEDTSFSHLLDSALLTDNSMCDLPISFGDLLNSPILHSLNKSSQDPGPLFANDCNIFSDATYNCQKSSQKEFPLFETNTNTDSPILCSFLPKNIEDQSLISISKLATKSEDHLSSQLDLAPPLLEPFINRTIGHSLQDNILSFKSPITAPDLSSSIAPKFIDSKLQENSLTIQANLSPKEGEGFLPFLNSIPSLIENQTESLLTTATSTITTTSTTTTTFTTTSSISTTTDIQENISQSLSTSQAAMNNVLSTALENSNPAQMENGNPVEFPKIVDLHHMFGGNDCPSPLLFSDDEEPPESPEPFDKLVQLENERSTNLNEFLMGLPPPKTLIKPQIDVRSMLELYYENKNYYFTGEKSKNLDELPLKENILRSKTTLEDVKTTSWPQLQSLRYFDIQYNNSLASEQFEALCMKLLERYVGAETASTCNAVYPLSSLGDSARKRAERRRRAVRSPGTRLSHLAQRRQIFSSENMLAIKNNPNKTQILVPVKRDESKKKGSSSKKKSKPSTSTKDTTRLNPKRALFQSPTEPTPSQSRIVDQDKLESTSRDLFGTGKRKRDDKNDSSPQNSSKKPNLERGKDTNSESMELSSTHQRKLLWAVAEALKSRGIDMYNANFRPWASRLARLCRRDWIAAAATRPGLTKHGSTSDKMLALANCHLQSLLNSTRTT